MQFKNGIFHMGKEVRILPPSRTPVMKVAECVLQSPSSLLYVLGTSNCFHSAPNSIYFCYHQKLNFSTKLLLAPTKTLFLLLILFLSSLEKISFSARPYQFCSMHLLYVSYTFIRICILRIHLSVSVTRVLSGGGNFDKIFFKFH